MVYRYSCYECPFAKVPRQGDITLADFGGAANYFSDLDTTRGISLILTNTDKGKKLFSEVDGCLEYRKSDIDSAAANNGNLVGKTSMPNIRSSIFDMIAQDGYEKVARTIFRASNYWQLRCYYKAKDIFGDNAINTAVRLAKKILK